MKILQINKFLYPKGGAETYLFSLSRLLAEAGHEVIYFSQKNPKNIPCPQEKYFISDLELGKFSLSSLFRIGRMFWSFKAAKNLKKLIIDERPDIVHLHNIYHQLSPSIIAAAKSAGLPVVMTVHDFKLIAHDYTLRADGAVSRSKKPFLAGLILRLESGFHRLLGIYDKIDLFISPSQFVKDRLVAKGFPAGKIVVIPHFIDMNKISVQPHQADGDYLLSFGRLDESKGFDSLIEAISLIGKKSLALKIAGSGPEEKKLRQKSKELELDGEIEFVGHKSKTDLEQLISGCKAVIFPTKVHETFGLAALESLAYGKPVLASRSGALPELIEDGVNGLLFSPGNSRELAEAINKIDDAKLLKKMSVAALLTAQKTEYSPENHLLKISEAYASAMR